MRYDEKIAGEMIKTGIIDKPKLDLHMAGYSPRQVSAKLTNDVPTQTFVY